MSDILEIFQIGRRLRDSCRNLRGKHSSGGSSNHDPQDYTSIQPANVSHLIKIQRQIGKYLPNNLLITEMCVRALA